MLRDLLGVVVWGVLVILIAPFVVFGCVFLKGRQ